MPRHARQTLGGLCYHVINRGNGGATVFASAEDYQAFQTELAEAAALQPLRILAYCLLPNHFHLVLWPRKDDDLGAWMRWLMTTQVRRHHSRHGTAGHLWQGRFKSFPIEPSDHLRPVLRYVEANPLRLGLVKQAEDWPWSSLAQRRYLAGKSVAKKVKKAFAEEDLTLPPLTAWPLRSEESGATKAWLAQVNRNQAKAELEALRLAVNRELPWGSEAWKAKTAKRLGRPLHPRPPGRPRKTAP